MLFEIPQTNQLWMAWDFQWIFAWGLNYFQCLWKWDRYSEFSFCFCLAKCLFWVYLFSQARNNKPCFLYTTCREDALVTSSDCVIACFKYQNSLAGRLHHNIFSALFLSCSYHVLSYTLTFDFKPRNFKLYLTLQLGKSCF